MPDKTLLLLKHELEPKFRTKVIPWLLNLFGQKFPYEYTTDVSAPWLLPMRLGYYHRLQPSEKSPKSDFCFFEELPREIIDLVNASPRGRLLLDLAFEMMPSRDDVVLLMHEAIERCGLSADRVVILNGNLRSTPFYEDAVARLGITEPVHVVGDDTIFWYCAGDVYYGLSKAPEYADWQDTTHREAFLEGRKRAKRFLALNRHPRMHRLLLMALLGLRGLMDKGIVSFVSRPEQVQPPAAQLARDVVRMFPSVSPDDAGSVVNAFYDALPMVIDLPPGGKDVNREFDKMADKEFYRETYFSVVTETLFFDKDTMFITEKVLKPMFFLHPFLYVGSPGTLVELRRLGFKTFSPWLDESYDEISDGPSRMAAIVEELDRLCAMTDDEIHALYLEIWPVLVHNRKVLCEDSSINQQNAMATIWSRCLG